MKNVLTLSALYIITLVVTLLPTISCMKDNPTLNPGNEEFFGTYMVRDNMLVDAYTSLDSVHFTVFIDRRYSMDFYEPANSSNGVDFCNHSGTIFDFGTPKAIFDPSLIIYRDCDSIGIPRGTYIADFINHGDTLIISKQVTDLSILIPYDSIFILKLIK